MGTGVAEPAGPDLTVKQAAYHLGVHYMTAYRYVRQGRLAAERRSCGWSIRACDLESFAQSRAEEAYGPDPVDWSGRLLHPLVAGDEPAAWSVTAAALAAGTSPAACCTAVIGGAMARLEEVPGGDRAAAGHLAGVVALRLVSRLGARFRSPGPARATVVLGSPAGEHHALGVATLANLLRWARFSVLELGTDVGPDAFVDAVGTAGRGASVGLSITHPGGVASAVETCRRLKAAYPDVTVVAGGRAVGSPELARILGAGRWAASPEGLMVLLEGGPDLCASH